MIQVLFNGVMPIFAIAAIGYFLGKRNIFDVAAAGTINKFAFLIAIPALNFRLIINAPFSEFDWLLLVGFFISELTVYVLGFLISKMILRCDLKESILLGLAASFGNHVLFVLPIALTLFGEESMAPIVAIIALDAIVIFGGTIIIMEALSRNILSYKHLCKNIFQNPPLVSILLGSLIAVLSIELPHGINVFVKFIGNIAAPMALFSLGVILSQTNLSNRIIPSLSVSALKLLCHPIIAWLILSGILAFAIEHSKTSLMVAGAPCGAMALVLALNYNVRTDAIAPAIFFTTLGSLISLTVIASW